MHWNRTSKRIKYKFVLLILFAIFSVFISYFTKRRITKKPCKHHDRGSVLRVKNNKCYNDSGSGHLSHENSIPIRKSQLPWQHKTVVGLCVVS